MVMWTEHRILDKTILASMEGTYMTATGYIFKRNYQAITLNTKSAVKIDGITGQIQ